MAIDSDVKALLDFALEVLTTASLMHHCQTSGDHGSLPGKAAIMEHLSKIEAVKPLAEKAGRSSPTLATQCKAISRAVVNAINAPGQAGQLDIALGELRDAADVASWTECNETTPPSASNGEAPTQTGTKADVVSFLRATHTEEEPTGPLTVAQISVGARCSKTTASRALAIVFGSHREYVASCEIGTVIDKLASVDGDGPAFGAQDTRFIDDNHEA